MVASTVSDPLWYQIAEIWPGQPRSLQSVLRGLQVLYTRRPHLAPVRQLGRATSTGFYFFEFFVFASAISHHITHPPLRPAFSTFQELSNSTAAATTIGEGEYFNYQIREGAKPPLPSSPTTRVHRDLQHLLLFHRPVHRPAHFHCASTSSTKTTTTSTTKAHHPC